jgi:hypothetical protein
MDKHIKLLTELLMWYRIESTFARQRPLLAREWDNNNPDNNNPENNKLVIYYGIYWYLITDLTHVSDVPNSLIK